MIKTISTKNMPHDVWLDHRRNAIGGSDAAAIVGLNLYCSAYEVWSDKLGLIPVKPDNEAIRIGRDLEEYVAQRFTEATGKRVRRRNAILYNTEIPFAHANVDRLVMGEDAGLECKTTSILNLKRFRDGNYPPHYYVQCQHYMMVTGMQKWYLAVLILGKEFLWFEIPRNEEDIKALYDAELTFWEHVISGTPPEVDGTESCSKAISALYKHAEPCTEVDMTSVQKYLEIRENIVSQIKELEVLKREQENKIKDFMEDVEAGYCEKFRVSWKNTVRTDFDSKRYMANHPEEDFSEYLTAKTYRTFRVTKQEE